MKNRYNQKLRIEIIELEEKLNLGKKLLDLSDKNGISDELRKKIESYIRKEESIIIPVILLASLIGFFALFVFYVALKKYGCTI